MIRPALKMLSIACLGASVALVGLWVRSYQHADRLQVGPLGERAFILASKQGRLTAIAFRLPPGTDWWAPGFVTFPAEDEMSFPLGRLRPHEAALGFGVIRQPYFMVTRSSFETPPGGTVFISGAAAATLNGSAVIVPYWLLVSLAAVAGALLQGQRPWRYTMRGLLVVVTLVAVLLGLVVGLDHAPDRWPMDDPVPLDEI